MFISRKTFRMRTNKTNKVGNSQLEIESANPITHSQPRLKNQIELVRYPAVYYLTAFLLIIGFSYLLYSANGGSGGIPGFMQKLWWQFLLAFVPLVIGVLILIFSQIESVSIEGDKIRFLRYFFKFIILGFRKNGEIERDYVDLINILIVKKGYQLVTITNTSYVLVFNFKGYDRLQAMECTSELTAINYLSQLNNALPHLRGSGKKITMRDIVLQG